VRSFLAAGLPDSGGQEASLNAGDHWFLTRKFLMKYIFRTMPTMPTNLWKVLTVQVAGSPDGADAGPGNSGHERGCVI